MRASSALLLSLILLLAAPPARGQDKRYTIEDLEALVKSAAWDEASQHLEDVPPAKRETRWKAVVEKTAIGQLRALDLDRSPLEALVLADAYTKRFGFLTRSRPFMGVRAELGIKGFERCFEQRWSSETCSDRLLPFVEGDKGNVDLALKAALLQVRNAYSYYGNPLWLLAVDWGKGTKKVCTTDRLIESVLAGLSLPPDHKMVAPAQRIADICFPYVKTKVQAAVGFDEKYEKENICPLLRRKKDLGRARCGGG